MIYTSSSSNALTHSENSDKWRKKNDLEKTRIASKYISKGPILEIGCGTGQILAKIKSSYFKIGLDYSSDRIESSIHKNKIFFIKSDVKKMPFVRDTFDNIIMSHFYHELIQFEDKSNFDKTFKEIIHKLKSKGRIIIIDHCDPGNNVCKFNMSEKNLFLYQQFKNKFKFYKSDRREKNNIFNKKNIQNFITKIWSLGTAAEKLEMNEDHTLLDPSKIFSKLKKYGFKKVAIKKFGKLDDLSKFYKLSEKKQTLFDRQFCLVMEKA
jgi:ubiquinone/menaquinone biosynthesis C-methylase UbiE